jgi:hypothetical protein
MEREEGRINGIDNEVVENLSVTLSASATDFYFPLWNIFYQILLVFSIQMICF